MQCKMHETNKNIVNLILQLESITLSGSKYHLSNFALLTS